MLWLNYFFIVALLVGLIAKYVSPQLFWLFAFFGIAFPFSVFINILFTVYWMVQFRRAALFSIGAVLCSVFTIKDYVQFSFTADPVKGNVKVTCYNSMLFDLYNWSKNAETRNNILRSLYEMDSDILCLQEFYNSEQAGDFHNIDTVSSLMKFKYYHNEVTATRRKFDHWGIITFSKYPIVNKGRIEFNTRSNNVCIYTDVLINSDTVRIYNMHLQSIHFSNADYKFIKDLQGESDAKDEVENSKSILRRLKRAFIKRSVQAEIVDEHMKGCRYKMIVCGDFNDTPASYTYHLINKDLEDAFVEKGRGFGKTYAGKFPQFRIDYILHSKSITCNKFVRHAETFTDHYPITAYLDLK